jgi:hypothetical protein
MRFPVRRAPSARAAGRAWFRIGVVLCAPLGCLLLWSAPALAAAPEAPEVTVESPAPATTATLHGVLNPDAVAPGEPLTYEFLYREGSAGCEGGRRAPEPPGMALGLEHEAVSEGLVGLLPNTEYTVCLLARNAAEETALSLPVTFTTLRVPPAIEGESSSEVGSSGVRLSATVNPNHDPSSYFFEYGTTTAYGSATQAASVGAGSEGAPVFAQVSGLESGAEYHFRVVAENANGETAQGADATFKTAVKYVFPPGVAGLPDGRGYELVSALENEDADVYTGLNENVYGVEEQTLLPMQVSADGSAVEYAGEPSAGGDGSLAQDGGGGNEYLATRSAEGGWVARNITLTGLPPGYAAFSSALANAGTSSVPAFSHVLSSEAGGLVDATGGRSVAVSVLPNGQAAPEAAFGAPSVAEAGEGNEDRLASDPDFSGVISADGSRIFWSTVELVGAVEGGLVYRPTALYVREDDASADARTVQVDASQGPGSSGGGRFWTASSDGSKVYFTDESQLTADSTAAPGAPDLYVYDVETGKLTDLTVDAILGEHADVHGVLGVGESPEGGAYVYFVAAGALAGGATPQTCEEEEEGRREEACNLYVLHEGEQPRFIATLSSSDNALFGSRAGGTNVHVVGDWRSALGLRTAEVTPDGRHLAFMATEALTGYGGSRVASEVFVYDAPVGSLSCVSCNPSGAPQTQSRATADSTRVPTSSGETATFMPRFISDEGSRVFFESEEQLTQKGLHSRIGVYEWEQDGAGSCQRGGGCIYLLSGGVLLGASATGDDVFVITKEDLVPQDRGEDVFVYDVRVGAPLPLAAPACTSTGCQGAPAAAPVFATPASVTFAGVGNFPPSSPAAVVKPKPKTAQCPRGKTRNKHGRCVKRYKKKAKVEKAGDKRRASS